MLHSLPVFFRRAVTATSTPVDRAPAASAATRNFAWRGQARALIDDLFERSPAIYWTDFLLSTGIGWALTAVLIAIGGSLFGALYPAWRASTIDPVEVMVNE